jgi:hypothetical protein
MRDREHGKSRSRQAPAGRGAAVQLDEKVVTHRDTVEAAG